MLVVDGEFVATEVVEGQVLSSELVEVEPNSVNVISALVSMDSPIEGIVETAAYIEFEVYSASLVLNIQGKDRLENAYKEFTYDDDGNLVQIDYWVDSSKSSSLGFKIFAYENEDLVQSVFDDGSQVITRALMYVDGNLVSISTA